MLTRGLGRSYGDASLPPPGRGPVASTLLADRVLALDETGGTIRAEAGLRLGRLVDLLLARGLFVPVTPGTQDVTLGGMIAADVHGKNHHVSGTIGAHVERIRMRLATGDIVEASRSENADLLCATLGGMGLTGHILDVTLRLERVPSEAIVEQAQAYSDFESLLAGLEEASSRWPMTVAWSDFLVRRDSFGRGVVLAGRWATIEEARPARGAGLPHIDVPAAMPEALLGNVTVGLYNRARYTAATARSLTERVRDARSFFYPLDAIGNWNLLYGRRGLTQYQCVLPRDASGRSYRRLAEAAVGGGPGPFLVVIKDCGDEGIGALSFPMPGISFALDFPVHDGTPALVARLNEIVAQAGGRIYLAKDAFTTAGQLRAMEPRVERFLELRRRFDPERRLGSALSARLDLD